MFSQGYNSNQNCLKFDYSCHFYLLQVFFVLYLIKQLSNFQNEK